MTRGSVLGHSMAAAFATMGDLRGEMFGSKHKGSKTPTDKKVDANRKKAKAAKKARAKNR